MANDMGKKLRELRDARGLTQREVVNAVGVTEATVSRWESGHINNMRRDKIEGLAKVLHVSPLVIMGKDGDTPAPPAAQPPTAPYRAPHQEMPEYIELHRIIQELPKADVDEILNMARFKKDRIKNKKEHIDDPDDF